MSRALLPITEDIRNLLWHLRRVCMPTPPLLPLHELKPLSSRPGEGVVIAVIDTGVSENHNEVTLLTNCPMDFLTNGKHNYSCTGAF